MKAKNGKGAVDVDGSEDDDDGGGNEEGVEEIEDPKEEEDDDEVNPPIGAQVQSVSDEDDDDDEGEEEDEDDERSESADRRSGSEGNRWSYKRPRYISPCPLLEGTRWSYKRPRYISPCSLLARFDEYFGKYPWYLYSTILVYIDEGCGFMMRDSPGAVSILEATHIINGKEASIRRILYILKIPKNATEEKLAHTFSEFGKVEEYDFNSAFRTIRRGLRFGLVMFDSEKVVDELVAKGTIEFCGEHLEVKKVELLFGQKCFWSDQPLSDSIIGAF